MKINLEGVKIMYNFVNIIFMNINRTLRMAIIAVCAVLLQIALVNCERVNDISQSDEQMPKIVSNWQIIDNNYVDEFGNHGNLWVDLNNPTQKVFEIVILSKLCNDKATGTARKIDKKGVISYACDNTANNCWYATIDGVRTLCSCPGTIAALDDKPQN